MQQYRGNDDAGFSVSLDELTGVVRVSAWGFWGPDVADSFAKTVSDVCRTTRDAARVIIDARHLKPQRDTGQAAIGAMMSALAKLGIKEASVTVSNALTKLQLSRLQKERANELVLQFTSAA